MTDVLSNAIAVNDTAVVEALADPFKQVQIQLRSSQTDVATRLQWLDMQSSNLGKISNTLMDSLAAIEQADMVEVAAKLKTTEITLAAVRESASRVMSMSLFDFLK
jgi:hypothetical protein